MTPWQSALALIVLGACIIDTICTLKWIKYAKRAIEESQKTLRALGYRPPEGDEEE